ncbi:hypothetical protein HII31_03289 [Pseudocercospora fuligena]|uniref:Apple domain-containing protein n=1 Tax=Pseudocercospora fuligena TaxID=685502 RepID=A0A8H6RRB5_9PEZI|nr:hypothetical protein HII31_03289 [Pseudocercospora fuligena]
MASSMYFSLSLAAAASLADARDVGLLRLLGVRQAETTITTSTATPLTWSGNSIAFNATSTIASTGFLTFTTSVVASTASVTPVPESSSTSELEDITTSATESTSTSTGAFFDSSELAGFSTTVTETTSIATSTTAEQADISASATEVSTIISDVEDSTSSSTESISTTAEASSPTSEIADITTSATESTSTATEVPLTCPASNGTSYTAPSGQDFIIECGIDHSGGDLRMVYVESLRECIEACDAWNGPQPCVDVSLSGSACYMKYVLGDPVPYEGLLGARLANVTTPAPPLSCPTANGNNYTTSSNETFAIECGVDFAGGDLVAQDVGSTAPNGNGELWLQNCIEACGSTQGCVGASLSGSACYMKSQIGATSNNSVITGIRLLSSQPNITACDANFPVCPACDGVILNSQDSDTELQYRVECGVDHVGENLAGDDGIRYGLRGVRRFRNCIEDCAEEDECVGVSFMGDQCYLKSSLGAEQQSDVVWGAVKVLG